MVKFKYLLTRELKTVLPSHLFQFLPSGYKRVGHIGILNLKPSLLPYAQIICERALKIASNVKSFAIASHVQGQFRKPTITILAGDRSPITVHREDNCIFKLDATELMFSSGNHYERKRLVKLTKPRDRILDMFCCVGNLSIPVACSRPDVQVLGIELNPIAYKYLLETIQLNRVESRFEAILGDNRKVTIPRGFDRIILGYFTVDDTQLTKALEALKPGGGILHIHDVPPWNETPMKARVTSVIAELKELDFFISDFTTRRIKWIAENTPHVVHDVQVRSTN